MTFFELDPFNLPLEEIFAHMTVMGSLEEYADIKSVTVSNGMVCLYSDRYLTEPRAHYRPMGRSRFAPQLQSIGRI